MPESLVGGIPVARLKEALKTANDEQLAGFLHSYAIAFAADQFIITMTPTERVAFLLGLAGAYPEEWTRAVSHVASGTNP